MLAGNPDSVCPGNLATMYTAEFTEFDVSGRRYLCPARQMGPACLILEAAVMD
jgi:hypothetical protein